MADRGEDVQKKGHDIVESGEKHPGGAKKRHFGLGKNHGQGIGYGGYSAEQDRSRSQTGAADPVRKSGGKPNACRFLGHGRA